MLKKKNDPEIITINYEGKDYCCLVKRTAKQNISISVKENGQIIIHSPRFSLKRTLKNIAEKNIIWIINKIQLQNIRNKNTKNDLKDQGTVKFLGKDYTIVKTQKQAEDVIIKGNKFYVLGNNEIDIKLLIKSFYRRQAKKIFTERIEYWIPKIKWAKPETKLVIKQMKTRWGSMSTAGNMNLNIALIKTPIECIDYLVVHELCHQKEMNHQKPFWDAVKSIMPEYKKYEKILKQYSTEY